MSRKNPDSKLGIYTGCSSERTSQGSSSKRPRLLILDSNSPSKVASDCHEKNFACGISSLHTNPFTDLEGCRARNGGLGTCRCRAAHGQWISSFHSSRFAASGRWTTAPVVDVTHRWLAQPVASEGRCCRHDNCQFASTFFFLILSSSNYCILVSSRIALFSQHLSPFLETMNLSNILISPLYWNRI